MMADDGAMNFTGRKKNEIQRYNEIGTGKGESIVDI